MSTKRSFAKIIVPLVIILNVLFTAAVLYIFLQWMLASIKKEKVRKGERENGEDKLETEINE